MNQKVEWEVVDAPAQHSQAELRPSLQQLMHALLGPWWRWKILGVAIVMGVVLAMLATLAGVFVLVATLCAVIAIGVGKMKQWLGAQPHSSARREENIERR